MKEFLEACLSDMAVMHDDQKMTIWRHISHPDEISLMQPSISAGEVMDKEIPVDATMIPTMECMFKEDITRFAIKGVKRSDEDIGSRWLYVDNERSNIGLMHFNGGSLTTQFMYRYFLSYVTLQCFILLL
jgi:hypothetical protein